MPARAAELHLDTLAEWRDGLRLCEVVEALERCAPPDPNPDPDPNTHPGPDPDLTLTLTLTRALTL